MFKLQSLFKQNTIRLKMRNNEEDSGLRLRGMCEHMLSDFLDRSLEFYGGVDASALAV